MDTIPAQDAFTVDQAAVFLSMSKACVIELLDNDILEYRELDGQRLIRRESLLDYESESREMREATTEITQQAQKSGFYD